MKAIEIEITKLDGMTMCHNTIRKHTLQSGDSAQWNKLISGSYGDIIKAGVLQVVGGKAFAKLDAGTRTEKWTTGTRTHRIQIFFKAIA